MTFHKSRQLYRTAFLFFVLFLFPGSSFAEKGDILDYSSLGITPASIEGASLFLLEPEVRRVRWGMSPEMVIEREGITTYAEAFEGNLLYLTVPGTFVADIPGSLTYIFPEGALSGIFCTFHSETLRLDKDITHFSRLEALLEEKYGAPLEKQVVWDNPESPYREKENLTSFGMAVALEDLRYHTEWHAGHTVIHLRLQGEHFRPRLTLTYQSTRLGQQQWETRRNFLLSQL
jgi:hypothetical protein